MTTAKTYDNLNRLTGVTSTPSGTGQLPFSYGASYNEANQRITVTMNDGSYWVYEYDTLGQITSAKKHFADGTFVPGQQFFFSFDHIGNRTTDALPTESVCDRYVNVYLSSGDTGLWDGYVPTLRLAVPRGVQKKMIHVSEYTNASGYPFKKSVQICAICG